MTVEQKGTIRTEVENIFPIIKRFLYSDHEIFLRELVSNAVDASQKLKTLAGKGEPTGDIDALKVSIKVDKENNTLTISDNGIGMTAEEVNKYINEIAFSSAKEFVDKYKEEASVIGHFGLGFYSAFMVADNVEIQTLSYKPDSVPVQWNCDGSTAYEMKEGTRTERGSDIILYIAEDSQEFLEDYRINELLNKYCKFLPIEIEFVKNKPAADPESDEEAVAEAVIINNTSPAWTKRPSELTDEDYKAFYKELYPYSFEEPLFWIHLNVDYPFNLTGILYFPKIKPNIEVNKDRISLYSNQVFVTDNVEEIVPDFMMLLQGVLDSPDIPLNVSRSYLQSDPNVKRISSHITKKVADKLKELFKNDREAFEEKWQDIGLFVKYGMISESKFNDKVKDVFLLKNLEDKHFTLAEYADHVGAFQTDKEEKVVMLYTNNAEAQHSYITGAKDRGYDVLDMGHSIDAHFINHLEMSEGKYQFKRVDANTAGQLVDKDEQAESVLNEEQEKTIQDLFQSQLGDQATTVMVKPMSPTDMPITVVKQEFMRRMHDMSAMGGGGGGMFPMGGPEPVELVVNANHPIIGKMLEGDDTDKQAQTAQQLTDLAFLSQGMLTGSKLTDFIKRSVELFN